MRSAIFVHQVRRSNGTLSSRNSLTLIYQHFELGRRTIANGILSDQKPNVNNSSEKQKRLHSLQQIDSAWENKQSNLNCTERCSCSGAEWRCRAILQKVARLTSMLPMVWKAVKTSMNPQLRIMTLRKPRSTRILSSVFTQHSE